MLAATSVLWGPKLLAVAGVVAVVGVGVAVSVREDRVGVGAILARIVRPEDLLLLAPTSVLWGPKRPEDLPLLAATSVLWGPKLLAVAGVVAVVGVGVAAVDDRVGVGAILARIVRPRGLPLLAATSVLWGPKRPEDLPLLAPTSVLWGPKLSEPAPPALPVPSTPSLPALVSTTPSATLLKVLTPLGGAGCKNAREDRVGVGAILARIVRPGGLPLLAPTLVLWGPIVFAWSVLVVVGLVALAVGLLALAVGLAFCLVGLVAGDGVDVGSGSRGSKPGSNSVSTASPVLWGPKLSMTTPVDASGVVSANADVGFAEAGADVGWRSRGSKPGSNRVLVVLVGLWSSSLAMSISMELWGSRLSMGMTTVFSGSSLSMPMSMELLGSKLSMSISESASVVGATTAGG